MAIYYPDGEGGRRILESGTTTVNIDATKAGAIIFRGVIPNREIFEHVKSSSGSLGDLWTLTFDDEDLNIKEGDLLIHNGEAWQVLGTSTHRTFYTLPTASESVKGGIVIGAGLQIVGDTLNAAQEYSLPTASTSTKGGIIVGKGLYMEGDVLNVSGASDIEQDKKSINIKNIIKGSGSETTTDSSYVLPTMSESVKGGAKLGQGLYMDGDTLNCTLAGGGTCVYSHGVVRHTAPAPNDPLWYVEEGEYPYYVNDISDTYGESPIYFYKDTSTLVFGCFASQADYITITNSKGQNVPYTKEYYTDHNNVAAAAIYFKSSDVTYQSDDEYVSSTGNNAVDTTRWVEISYGSTLHSALHVSSGLQMDGDTLTCTVHDSFLGEFDYYYAEFFLNDATNLRFGDFYYLIDTDNPPTTLDRRAQSMRFWDGHCWRGNSAAGALTPVFLGSGRVPFDEKGDVGDIWVDVGGTLYLRTEDTKYQINNEENTMVFLGAYNKSLPKILDAQGRSYVCIYKNQAYVLNTIDGYAWEPLGSLTLDTVPSTVEGAMWLSS